MTADLGPRPRTGRPGGARGARLLVVDTRGDDRLVCELAELGVEATVTGTTADALVLLGRLDPHVVVVAPSVPGPLDAAELVATVRAHSAALVVAALDVLDGPDAGPLLVAGAGAAVTRPYTAASLCEVLARFAPGLADGTTGGGRVSYGPLEVDPDTYAVVVHGTRAPDLPGKEFELLHALLRRAPGVVGNDELRASLWGSEGVGPSDNTIAVHVARLRHRLEGVARIRRLRGRGYALTLD
ncbi:winged helix-turn-helix domain-containing protein [Nocardioides sp. SOB77]|uniref:Winged helix-turn-helix domain-containing protein n=1 Tax=Nocardioides oceani TaxID=3058369 RepID=A0ABT8FCX4_9ACTN|nr:winged helix-turn-helix domain-containing protein [Nocardioides oceani]MDN4172506.1 winged helix-turn-helix domain-containing protein [Nocardioides oceani]